MAGVEAEAELLAAMVTFFQRVGLTSKDVVIKVSSRQVLQAVLEQHNVPVEATSRVFVTVDKMDKLPKETVSALSVKLDMHLLIQAVTSMALTLRGVCHDQWISATIR